MSDKITINIPTDKWDQFLEWANSPPVELPELRRLANTKPVWDEN